MWMPPKEPGGRLSPVSRRKERDSDRSSDVAIGVAAASDRVRAHAECALPGRQRRSDDIWRWPGPV